uniref:Uncharacterized protein n=1 Tax=Rhizophora mucronata TaxID=61149 RepID=A0A2P2LHZ8_RHIMU
MFWSSTGWLGTDCSVQYIYVLIFCSADFIFDIHWSCSTRKRQSVVCRYPDGRLVLYCKVLV